MAWEWKGAVAREVVEAWVCVMHALPYGNILQYYPTVSNRSMPVGSHLQGGR